MMPKHKEIFPSTFATDLSLVRPWTDEEVRKAADVGKEMSQFAAILSGLEDKFGREGMLKVAARAASWVPRQYADYWASVATMAASDWVSPETSTSVAKVTDRVLSARTVTEAQVEVDSVIRDIVGISGYSNPLLEMTLAPLGFFGISMEYPPQRVGVPRLLRTETSWDVLSFSDVDEAVVEPRDGWVRGPLLEVDGPARVEVRAAPIEGRQGFLMPVVWVLFEMRWCWWVERAWLPFSAGWSSSSFPREAVVRFSLAPDRVRVFGYRVHPFAGGVRLVRVRRVA